MSSSVLIPSHHCDLFKYWNAVRGVRPMPTRSDIDPMDIIPLLPFLALIERRSDGYFWRLIGTTIVDHFGHDFTGQRYGAHASPPAFAAAMTGTFDAALEDETPFFDESIYRSSMGHAHAVSRLVCPLKAVGPYPPMVILTRIHRICSDSLHDLALDDQPRGELQNRWQIASLDDVDRRTEEWTRTACLPIETRELYAV
jgi:hypothetical protein